jgi:hypothetical protein
MAREPGFLDVVDLLKVAKHGKGDNIYLVGFHYVPPGAKQPSHWQPTLIRSRDFELQQFAQGGYRLGGRLPAMRSARLQDRFGCCCGAVRRYGPVAPDGLQQPSFSLVGASVPELLILTAVGHDGLRTLQIDV